MKNYSILGTVCLMALTSCSTPEKGQNLERFSASLATSSATCISSKYKNRYDVTIDGNKAQVAIYSPDFKQSQKLTQLEVHPTGQFFESMPPKTVLNLKIPGFPATAFSVLVEKNPQTLLSMTAMKLSDRFNMGTESEDSSIKCGPLLALPTAISVNADNNAKETLLASCRIKLNSSVTNDILFYEKKAIFKSPGKQYETKVIGKDQLKQSDNSQLFSQVLAQLSAKDYVDVPMTASVAAKAKSFEQISYEDVTGYEGKYMKVLNAKNKMLYSVLVTSQNTMYKCR